MSSSPPSRVPVPVRTAFWIAAAAALLVLPACDEEEIAPENTDPIVGIMELPISLRHDQPQPADAIRLELSPTEMRMDGKKVVDLERGRVPDKEEAGGIIPALAARIETGSARRAAAIRIHVNVPYETLTLLLATLKKANIHTAAFEVRKGQTAAIGFLVLDHFEVVPESEEPIGFEGAAQRSWDEFVAGWEESYTACRRDHYVDCDPKPSVPAEGGDVEITLFARGSAAKIELQRFNVGDEEEASAAPPQPEMLEGVPPPEVAVAEEIVEPVKSGAFTWRGAAITDELSPVSGAMRPLCGARTCGVVVEADSGTMSMRVLSLIGAAFPNGTEAPRIKFQSAKN